MAAAAGAALAGRCGAIHRRSTAVRTAKKSGSSTSRTHQMRAVSCSFRESSFFHMYFSSILFHLAELLRTMSDE